MQKLLLKLERRVQMLLLRHRKKAMQARQASQTVREVPPSATRFTNGSSGKSNGYLMMQCLPRRGQRSSVLTPVPTLMSLQLKWQHLHEELAAQASFVQELQSENERLQSENAILSQPVVARDGSRQQLCPAPIKQVGLETHHLSSLQSQISLSCLDPEVSRNTHCHKVCSWAQLEILHLTAFATFNVYPQA